jgi:hypothetical protein
MVDKFLSKNFRRHSTLSTQRFVNIAFRRQITAPIESEGVGMECVGGCGVRVWSVGVGVSLSLIPRLPSYPHRQYTTTVLHFSLLSNKQSKL